ncbi:hypothetical protein IJG14_04725, partial [bacterium]|nr:hypothetical protein [bacterium]
SATLQNDLYVNNKLVANTGSIVYGTATQAEKASGGYKNASLTIVFDKIITTEGEELNIKSEPIIFQKTDSDRGVKIAKTLAGSIVASVAVTALSNLVFHNTNNWNVTLPIGAAIGAVGGGFVLLNSRGEEIELKEGLVLDVNITSIIF